LARLRTVVILAAGQGTRTRSSTPKVLFDVCGIPSLCHLIELARSIGVSDAADIRVVVPAEHAAIAKVVAEDATLVVQDPPLGTGHAVRAALSAGSSTAAVTAGELVVLYGDGPTLRAATIERLLEHHRTTGAAETLLTAVVDDPDGLGRIVRGPSGPNGREGAVDRVVEEFEADAGERAIREVNTGVLALDLDVGTAALESIDNQNRKGEYYLTDLVQILRSRDLRVEALTLDDVTESASFNDLRELAVVRRIVRDRVVREHQANGVDIVDPDSTWIDVGVEIGADTRILPGSLIGRGVRIGRNCVIGPFAHLRVRAVLEDGAEVGNFVEVKNSTLAKGAKAKHLTYLGDATVGERANIGCGTITANYDGVNKHRTTIGDGAFIGSGTVLIAPARIGKAAKTGAGAVVTRDSEVPDGDVWVGVPARSVKGRTR